METKYKYTCAAFERMILSKIFFQKLRDQGENEVQHLTESYELSAPRLTIATYQSKAFWICVFLLPQKSHTL